MCLTIEEPPQVFEAFDYANENEEIHTIVIDTFTFLMERFESLYIVNSANSMAGWGQYAQYVKTLMQDYVAKTDKNVIILAHTADSLNESEALLETIVKIKGSTMNQGVEAWFTEVIATKKVSTKKLAKYANDLLTITEKEEALGFKHVFQTQLTKETIGERLRSTDEMWELNETFINNDCQLVIDRLHQFHAE